MGTEFPLPSYVLCIDSAETPKTLALQKTKENELDEFISRGLKGSMANLGVQANANSDLLQCVIQE